MRTYEISDTMTFVKKEVDQKMCQAVNELFADEIKLKDAIIADKDALIANQTSLLADKDSLPMYSKAARHSGQKRLSSSTSRRTSSTGRFANLSAAVVFFLLMFK